MLDPAAPNVKKGSRSAANSRAVNRDLTSHQYGMSITSSKSQTV